jgi:hypothetical protein
MQVRRAGAEALPVAGPLKEAKGHVTRYTLLDPVHGLALCGQALKHLPVAGPLKEAKGHGTRYTLLDPVHGVSASQVVVHGLALWQALKEAKGHVTPNARDTLHAFRPRSRGQP